MIEINNKEDCCGCHACFNICPHNAINMVEDEYGFKFPRVQEQKCVKCGLCVKVCPMLKEKIKKDKPRVYACINNDEEIRINSSSGGIFYLIAREVLNQGGVVFGAKFNKKFKVEHDYIEKIEEIFKFMGSKYVQSNIGETYKKVKKFLENDRVVLFTGTPCQIEGLKSFLNKDYEKLYTQDIVCHGVPSPMVWENYINYISGNSNISYVNFRNKDNGWSNYNTEILSEKKKYKISHEKDLYMNAFLNDIILRDSCYSCRFKEAKKDSDITLADFWGIEQIDRKFYDNKGTSLVIINSEKGNQLFEKISSKIVYKQFDFNDAIRYNKSIVESSNKNKNRELFLDNLKVLGMERTVKKYIKNKSILSKIKWKIKIFFKK